MQRPNCQAVLAALGHHGHTQLPGNQRTLRGQAIRIRQVAQGFDALAGIWEQGAPLGWDLDDATPVADACLFLLSDLARAITGEILHVDGGFHAMGV